MPAPTQPDPAEGPREDDLTPATQPGVGVSAEDPAEGAEDAAPRQPGSPQG